MTDPRAAAESIQQGRKLLEKPFPETIGEWVRTGDEPLDYDSKVMLQCHSSFAGTYSHPRTGARASVFVLMGPPGPIAAHTPEICVPSDVFEHTNRKPMPLDQVAKAGDLWNLTFTPKDSARSPFQCVYGWSNGGPWKASDWPRFEFASSPYLYKLQVSYSAPRESSELDGGSLQDFLSQFLPECSARLRSE